MRASLGPAATSSARSARCRLPASGWSRSTSIPTHGRGGMAAWSVWLPAANTTYFRRCAPIRSKSASTNPARDEMILLNTWGDRGTRHAHPGSVCAGPAAGRGATGDHAFPARRWLAGWPIPPPSCSQAARWRISGRADYWVLYPVPVPEWAWLGRSAKQGVGHRTLPVVQPQQGQQLCPLAQRRRRVDRPISAVRHPHFQDRRRDDPRQRGRSQPAPCSSG